MLQQLTFNELERVPSIPIVSAIAQIETVLFFLLWR